ncbi:hypothetical protein C0995_000771 [Termitomyces sp. Mi166|nr:hypothetical protein C0995_000771 [Termitomyces sp. Mi166\
MAVELEPTAPVVAPIVSVVPVPIPVSAASLIKHVPSVLYVAKPSSPPMQGKGKIKATEDDNDDKDKATQTLWEELKNFVLSATFSDKELVALLPLSTEYYEGDVDLPQGAKILGGRKGELTLVNCLWNGVGVRVRKKHSPVEVLLLAKHVKLVQAAKAFLKHQGKPS